MKLSVSPSIPCKNSWQPFYLTRIDQNMALSLGENPSAINAANQFSISIQDILNDGNNDDIKHVCLMNYMIDPSWLFQSNPILCKVPVLLLHGHKEAQEALQQTCFHLPNVMSSIVHVENWGTHHTKMMMIHYTTGIRIVIGTPNLIPGDWALKTQGFYIQDFPLLSLSTSSSSSYLSENTYRDDLYSYLKHVGYKVNAASQHVLEKQYIDKLRNYDFSSAEVVLIPSVPGHHDVVNMNNVVISPLSSSSSSSSSGGNSESNNLSNRGGTRRINKWGHLKLRDELTMNSKRYSLTNHNDNTNTQSSQKDHQQQQQQPSKVNQSCLVMQCSSISSLGKDESFLLELADTMMTDDKDNCTDNDKNNTNTNNNNKTGKNKVRAMVHDNHDYIDYANRLKLIWPTDESVRLSYEGYVAGGSLPCSIKTIYQDPGGTILKPWLSKILHVWDGSVVGRKRAAPHIKTYCRVRYHDGMIVTTTPVQTTAKAVTNTQQPSSISSSSSSSSNSNKWPINSYNNDNTRAPNLAPATVHPSSTVAITTTTTTKERMREARIKQFANNPGSSINSGISHPPHTASSLMTLPPVASTPAISISKDAIDSEDTPTRTSSSSSSSSSLKRKESENNHPSSIIDLCCDSDNDHHGIHDNSSAASVIANSALSNTKTSNNSKNRAADVIVIDDSDSSDGDNGGSSNSNIDTKRKRVMVNDVDDELNADETAATHLNKPNQPLAQSSTSSSSSSCHKPQQQYSQQQSQSYSAKSTSCSIELEWFLLTSANLSQAAWGVLQRSKTKDKDKNQQTLQKATSSSSSLYIKSFEIGVLYLPGRVVTNERLFSCTPNHPVLGMIVGNRAVVDHYRDENCIHNILKTSSSSSSSSSSSKPFKRFTVSSLISQTLSDEIYFPVPYSLSSPRYNHSDTARKGGDVPWAWDRS